MLRTWVIAGIALAASTGPILGQDAAAGEQVFKRLCSPCHEIGQDAKIKLGPPLNGIDGRESGTFEGFNYSPAIFWHHPERGNFPQIYPRADARNAGHAHSICRHRERQGHRRPLGLSQAVRGRWGEEMKLTGKRGKSKRAAGRVGAAARLTSMWADWPAQPYLKPAQTI